jgi:hypothetical protein
MTLLKGLFEEGALSTTQELSWGETFGGRGRKARRKQFLASKNIEEASTVACWQREKEQQENNGLHEDMVYPIEVHICLCHWLKLIFEPHVKLITHPNSILVEMGLTLELLWNLVKLYLNLIFRHENYSKFSNFCSISLKNCETTNIYTTSSRAFNKSFNVPHSWNVEVHPFISHPLHHHANSTTTLQQLLMGLPLEDSL